MQLLGYGFHYLRFKLSPSLGWPRLFRRYYSQDSYEGVLKAIQTHPVPSSRLLLGYTCKKCQKRSYKSISKLAYNKGVVIVQCAGCQGRHLIADHLGWFSNLLKDSSPTPGDIETILREKGESITTNYVKELDDNDDIQILPNKLDQ